jgi:CobW/HypB/UreG, nucleotide-binding domain
MSDRRPTLVLAGGFLGAGKTTLLLAAAGLLAKQGRRAAMITNDQGGKLVDTRIAAAAGVAGREVSGACFCCRFAHFIDAAEKLAAAQPDVIFAEPVGSCVDLSATVLQPLKHHYGSQFRLAPLSVLVDPEAARELLQPDADPAMAFLFTNQIAEADLVVFTKTDLHRELPELPGISARRVSAATGIGVAEWLDEVLGGRLRAGGRLLNVDYVRYAAAEAALGWLNWEAELTFAKPVTPASVAGPLLERLDEELTRAGARIVHLKIFDRAETGYIKASICRNGAEPSIEGDLIAAPARRHECVVNLRARALPVVLGGALELSTSAMSARTRVMHYESFQPAAPLPEHRFQSVVDSIVT